MVILNCPPRPLWGSHNSLFRREINAYQPMKVEHAIQRNTSYRKFSHACVCSLLFVGVVPSVSAMHLHSTAMATSDICEYFTIGGQVKIVTLNYKEYKGEVVAFDHKTKTLIISILWKSQSPLKHKGSRNTWGFVQITRLYWHNHKLFYKTTFHVVFANVLKNIATFLPFENSSCIVKLCHSDFRFHFFPGMSLLRQRSVKN